ncbi:MAG: hypothetical protein RLZZ245_2839 [Verrucomicrobiota bacterium]|jgi:hypothetical protein
MKRPLLILLALGGGVFAQTAAVTKNPSTNQITGNLVMGANRVLQFDANSFLMLNGVMRTSGYGAGGKVQIDNSGIIFGGVDGMLAVQARDNHAIVARTPNPSDGIALVGWSSSGAAGVKAVQDTYFNSPALTVWRDLSQGSSGLENSAGLLVATSNGSSTTEKAVEVQASGTSNFHITWNGFATSRDKPLMRFHGRRSSAPTGTYGTDFSAGDVFFNTADNKFYCHDGVSWKAM